MRLPAGAHPVPRRLALLGAVLVSGCVFLLTARAAATSDDPARSSGTGGNGITYRNERIPDKPLSVHVVKVERSRPDLVLGTTLAKGTVFDLSPLSEQVKAAGTTNSRPMVGINGDFYRTEQEPFAGDPLGFQVMGGELVSGAHTNHPCFWMDAAGQPHIGMVGSRFVAKLPDGTELPFELNEERLRGTACLYTPRLGTSTRSSGGGREIVLEGVAGKPWLPVKPCVTYEARVRAINKDPNTPLASDILVLSVEESIASKVSAVKPGDVITLSMATEPSTLGCEVAIGGGPTLLHDGVRPDYRARDDRHPRSAFGWNDTHWFFVEVDGRQSNLSIGMKLPELLDYMAKLGAKEALNLDGGGSATLWLYGQVVNSPCYGYERNTANGLIILKKDLPRREPD
jgi:hypothetical protein